MRKTTGKQAGKLMEPLSKVRSLDQKDWMLQREMDLFSMGTAASVQIDDPTEEAGKMNQAELYDKARMRQNIGSYSELCTFPTCPSGDFLISEAYHGRREKR